MQTLLKNLLNLINCALQAGHSIFAHSQAIALRGEFCEDRIQVHLNTMSCLYLSKKNLPMYRKINFFTASVLFGLIQSPDIF
jgi:hypothetical protein